MRIGVIGTGNMGGMLAEGFAAAYPDATVVVHNRTLEKAVRVALNRSNIQVVTDVSDAVSEMDMVFVCTKASDGYELLRQIGPEMNRGQILITTISTISLTELERITIAHVGKVVPSIVQTTQGGVILVSYGPSMPVPVRDQVHKYLSAIGRPFCVDESQIRVCSDLSSCGPAFIAELMMEWASAASKTGVISSEEAQLLLADTLVGLAGMLRQGIGFSDIISRVAIPGGVTETGMSVLRQEAPSLFEHLHTATYHHASGRRPSEVGSPFSAPP